MNTLPATELDADGNPVRIAACWPDPADEIDGPSPQTLADARIEGGQEMLRLLAEAVAGIERVPSDRIAEVAGLRALAFLVKCGRQPLGCEDLAALGRKLRVSRNAAWQASERVESAMLPPPRDRSP